MNFPALSLPSSISRSASSQAAVIAASAISLSPTMPYISSPFLVGMRRFPIRSTYRRATSKSMIPARVPGVPSPHLSVIFFLLSPSAVPPAFSMAASSPASVNGGCGFVLSSSISVSNTASVSPRWNCSRDSPSSAMSGPL